eukprot:TRINITY_DN2179_c0_g1_i1.p1 TRINITY_DN2179_c0_g1~~TRINITY_DN2179_c0_g1_i1.p1  ORF type:complete len:200 (+),score=48.58 TRINITY_DN2179_c0_g1_i1:75-674(+)
MARSIFAVAVAAALSAAPCSAYVSSGPGAPKHSQLSKTAGVAPMTLEPMLLEIEEPTVERSTGAFGVLAAGFGLGAVLGWLNSRKKEVASVAAATAVAVTPAAANAYVDYEGLAFLGGSDKVDINNANVQAYKQFPGFFPTAAGVIATHGPYKEVKEIFDIPNVDPRITAIFKKYEQNLVCLPANPAYFIDRVNNGLYR